jgi:ATP-dependent exoDNAse (exonuclease V) alpha subunit
MLINFTNHPFDSWNDIQKEAAIEKYQKVLDVPFPHINPDADELDIKADAAKYLEQILKLEPSAVHIMGEMNFTFQMVNFLMKEGIECIASTTSRIVKGYPDGTQKSLFKFVKFRSYNFLVDESIKTNNKSIELSIGQKSAFEMMKAFISDSENDIFVLKGYAGTGKTTLLNYFIKECYKTKKTVTLMASTGRAAAVLRKKAKFSASTVHSIVYKFDEVKATSEDAWKMEGDEKGQLYFSFSPNPIELNDKTDIYIIDEASMISGHTNEEIDGTKFGTGNLLSDFLLVIGNAKIIFVGDPCQLPPVDEISFSAALDNKFLEEKYKKKVIGYELNEVLRQGENSEILEIATPLREQIVSNHIPEWPKLEIYSFFNDIKLFNSTDDLINQYLSVLKTLGSEKCILITHKNSEAHTNNQTIRKALFPGKDSIQKGDVLMVVKNCMLTSLRNGDQVIVLEVGSRELRAKLNFLNIKVKDVNSGVVYETKIIETLLNNSNATLGSDASRSMIIDFDLRMSKVNVVRNSIDYKMKMKSDTFLNALHAKYGYSITLQKAQGGEWSHVFLNITKSVYISKFNGKPQDMLKWFYTAVTRTQKHLYLNRGSWIQIKN